MYWKQINSEEINTIVSNALKENASFRNDIVLGVPGTFLDREVFHEVDFLENAPYLKAFVENPNHIGCHTEGESESFFRGTHKIEIEALRICAEEILDARPGTWDGYMATGGTEGNIQGLWVQRNFFIEKFNANFSEIALISSEDTHYSIDKAANLLGLIRYSIKVDMNTREIVESDLRNCIKKAKREGKKYFCCILNMGTTMFGSVDDIDSFTRVMNSLDIEYGIHVDAAFGGFIYPFVNKSSKLSFKNEKINSFSLDAHKMLQAPYGSGIFLMKKGLVKNVISSSAKYVKGMDSTLCGSRSGANAIATWMILSSYGSSGGVRFCNNLISITNIFCKKLDSINVKYYRNMFMNVIAISSESINEELAREFFLVPDTHNSRPNWWKIVVMDHVEVEHLDLFFSKLNS